MGSKSKIMDFVLEGINEVHDGRPILDLFAGSCSLAGAIGQQAEVVSNDIQSYSSILADTYNLAYQSLTTPSSRDILLQASEIVERNCRAKVHSYDELNNLSEFNQAEQFQKDLINETFDYEWHLFAKNYSGTWWSYEQCVWIDAIREVAERYRDNAIYPAILSSLMFAMAYTSQGTGHYAQYRDAKTTSSLKDIVIYRKRKVHAYFQRKFDDLIAFLPKQPPSLKHQSTSLDYKEALRRFDGGTIYADPPYCFVHYSRFYHALETLTLYDYPNLQVKGGKVVKGRYREIRHQSPFCIRSQVKSAFVDLFAGAQESKSSLVLSYSNTGMISLESISELAREILDSHKLSFLTTDHQHMTMGRREDRQRSVKEGLLIAKV